MSRPAHKWGVSPSADRVRAQVSGLGAGAGARQLMVLQAFMDESVGEDGTFVIAGYIADAEAWTNFSLEWEKMVEGFGVLDSDGRKHFKMSEMAWLPERMERVAAFYRIIEDHVSAAISIAINVNDLDRARRRVHVPGATVDWVITPYGEVFEALMDIFHGRREEFAGPVLTGAQVDFIFDNNSEKKAIIVAWDQFVSARPQEVQRLFGATPSFQNDKVFLPLQAADFWAWWVRKWAGESAIPQIDAFAFPWAIRRQYPQIHMGAGEEGLVRSIIARVSGMVPPGTPIIDLGRSS